MRKHERCGANIRVRARGPGAEAVGLTRDLSGEGLRLLLTRGWPPGAVLAVELWPEGFADPVALRVDVRWRKAVPGTALVSVGCRFHDAPSRGAVRLLLCEIVMGRLPEAGKGPTLRLRPLEA